MEHNTSGRYVLVTGTTGLIGAHVLDELLQRGHRVRGVTRSAAKAEQMLQARSQYRNRLDFVTIEDLLSPDAFKEAVKEIDGIIHCASPVDYSVTDVEEGLLKPAIGITKSIIQAAASAPKIRRIVITSSFGAVFDASQGTRVGYTYTSADWSPVTFEEAKTSGPVVGYRGAKKYAELAAWDYVREHKPHFDIAIICPTLVFGPVAHPLARMSDINESNAGVWAIASGKDIPTARVPCWVDVRDVAKAHVEALVRPEASQKRFLVSAPEKFAYQRIADIIRQEFPWTKEEVQKGNEGAPIPDFYDVDGEEAAKALGLQYRTLKESIVESVTQFKEINEHATQGSGEQKQQ